MAGVQMSDEGDGDGDGQCEPWGNKQEYDADVLPDSV